MWRACEKTGVYIYDGTHRVRSNQTRASGFLGFRLSEPTAQPCLRPLRPSEMSMPETRGEHLRLWAVVRENGSLVSRLRTCGAFSLGSRCLMGRLPCAAMSCGRLDRDTSSAYQKARL